MQKVSEKIRNLRLEKKMTLRGLAQSAGISSGALSQIESAQVSPSVATLEKIAAGLSGSLPENNKEQSCSRRRFRCGKAAIVKVLSKIFRPEF